jgi:hypothetical protein
MNGPGWVFWGLFAACAAVLLAFLAWVLWEERR